ncbi:hypothetical protein HBA55_34505 [Pseudomaricurvus alkylphenolicus]|uniref:hypothetical protein n=1 Tax=Pseudomaricurvus alkylphenolicus TaxID=1306991 RepID=UPI0014228500|nr:hypothetical protein [Pseudomaricurvus alkylphenolicus]NIB44743.1 hypothetical protein [Pseudomaricurvus alkylphenolicus]
MAKCLTDYYEPPNEDTSLENRHVFVAAKTGGGKSQVMRNEIVPAKNVRAVFWDPDKDHRCNHFNNRRQYLTALAKAHKARRPFRIGWSGDSSKESFAWWCESVWGVLDGKFDTWIVTEELADLDMQNRTIRQYNTLNKRSRKYGGIMVGNTQRIQEVPKTLVTQSAVVWIGQHEYQDAAYIEKMTGLKKADLSALEPLNFFRKEKGEWVPAATKYRKFGNSSGKRNEFKR